MKGPPLTRQIIISAKMKSLSIKSIVEFRTKSDKGKKNFALALKKDNKKLENEGGGDYWISCLSAISNSFRMDDLKPIVERKGELEERFGRD